MVALTSAADSTTITRRTFLGTVGTGAAALVLPRRTAVTGEQPLLRAAWLSDAHLLDPDLNDSFASCFESSVFAVNSLDPHPDFVVFGGDLAHVSNPAALARGIKILAKLKAPLRPVAGEHDWYLDLGVAWEKHFGQSFYSFTCRGVFCVVVNTVVQDDFWTQSRLDSRGRMLAAAGLGGEEGRSFGLDQNQRDWLAEELAPHSPDEPIVVFAHSAAAELRTILRPFRLAIVIHGHNHDSRSGRLGGTRFQSMLSTAWPMAEETRCGFGIIEVRSCGIASVTHVVSG